MKPNRHWRLGVAAILASVGAGCGADEETPLGPATSVRVLTRNLYLGGDFAPFFEADGVADVPGATAKVWAEITASDLPGRAAALAAEIADLDPDLVGLQEVELFRVQSPSDFDYAAAVANAGDAGAPGTTETIDLLDLLLTELRARGADYDVAVASTWSDVEMPADTTGGLVDVRLTDRDVILVRSGVTFASPRGARYAHELTLPVGGSDGVPIDLIRGWQAVDVRFDGAEFVFANTHLEVDGGPFGILGTKQEAEGAELVQLLAKEERPVLLAGDFNSAADGSSTDTYGTLTRSYRDAWVEAGATDQGLTCCSALDAPAWDGYSRIDLVLYRGRARANAVERTGVEAADRTASGLWPSDHAGVVAEIAVERSP